MSVSLTAAEQGAGDVSAGPARHRLLPPQLANALAPSAAPREMSGAEEPAPACKAWHGRSAEQIGMKVLHTSDWV